MKYIRAVLGLVITGGLVFVLNNPVGPAPALGRFLSPFEGFWQNLSPALDTEATLTEEKLDIPGLKGQVTVLYDDNRVPHIFAENDHDLYLAQGYVQARDRLWQMDFVARAAGGRLAEVVGERALPLDRYKRRMGSVYGAEQSLALMDKEPKSKEIAEAYCAGINAYIKQLSPKDYPLEFKLLGYAPEDWTPLKCTLLIEEMSFTLASGTDELRLSNVRNKVGAQAANELFPDYPFIESPIIPVGTKWDFAPLPTPKAPELPTDASGKVAYREHTQDPGIGSNNWAIHGSKSATGLPILAGDPHLQMSLPSIWYQIQLVAPGINVCGVTLPGSPGVVIGFNENVAWSPTNVGSDVTDWYKIQFKDGKKAEYLHDGKYKPTKTRLEVLKIKGKPEVVDTVYYTHHGPVVYQDGEKSFSANTPVGYALRWVAHEPNNSLKTFYELNRAKGYDDYVKALSYYAFPAQNFCFASNENNVAIWVNGLFPLKWKEQGKYLLDGTVAANDWASYIPHAHNPHVRNPERGFVSSANQFSTDPSYPYYLHWNYAPANRGRRINERLEKMTAATVDSLRLLQFDNMNVDARDFLPGMLALVQEKELSAPQKAALAELKKWNRINDADEIGPSIFEEWVQGLMDATWKDDLPDSDSLAYRMPTFYRTVELSQKQPTARWFDNQTTKGKVETASDVFTAGLKASLDSLTKRHGSLGPDWAWWKVKNTSVRHLLPGMDALSRIGIKTGGGARIVNASGGGHGPSWRMVVQLGKQGPKAYGLYPGGQSGHPGSPYYDNMIDKWAKGELNELLYLKSKEEQSPRIKQRTVLSKK